MRLLIVIAQPDGSITDASVHDVQNPDTWQVDGGLVLQDGRLHVYPGGTLLFDVALPITPDVLAWARHGKYMVVAGELHEVEGWSLANPSPFA